MQRANHLGEEVLMLAYALNRPVAGKRPSSPSAMLLIISVHVALIALAMSAKMEIDRRHKVDGPTIYIPPAPPPPPPIGTTVKKTDTWTVQPTRSDAETKLPPVDGQVVGGDTSVGQVPVAGSGESLPGYPPIATSVHHDARLLTPPSELRPPYPESKIISEEEATLQLRLTISDSGRVVAVDPVGAADRVFLDAARRYLIAHWRYQPATEDGRAVGSTIVISLRFQLDG
jgi:protein TonB